MLDWFFTLDPGNKIALASFIVALIALVFAVLESRRSRKNSILSVRPHITIRGDTSHKKRELTIYLSNDGVGPAFIGNLEIILDGKIISESGLNGIGPYLDKLFSGYEIQKHMGYLRRGCGIKEKEHFTLLKIELTGDYKDKEIEIAQKLINKISISIKYVSLHEIEYSFSTIGQKIFE